ncbi:MAG: hypothetical protein MUF34_05930 [Polyangiaceae bacterium]|nr:hypothetical protein [Polyangiaceae bacterium]
MTSVPEIKVVAPNPRRAALERGALRSGDRWVERTREQLSLEGRTVEGGWPGTMSEARGLVASVSGALKPALTFEESDWVAKTIYTHAKRLWQARREPERRDVSESGGTPK